MDDVRELRVLEPRGGCSAVLSDGLKLAWFDDLAFVDFSVAEYDLSQIENFRKARRYVAARELRWRIEAYDR